MTFLDVLVARGIPFRREHSRPNEVGVCCPFCLDRGETPDTRFRLSVNIVLGKAYCFNCRWSSSNKTYWKVLRRLLGDFSDSVVVGESGAVEETEPEEEIGLPDDFLLLSEADLKRDPLALQAHHYAVQNRKLTVEQIKRKAIGASFDGRYAYRLIIPVVHEQELRGFVARALGPDMKPKYLNSLGTKSVYNLTMRPHQSDALVHISEGVFKALRIEQALGEASIALLGHSMTNKQREQIRDSGFRRAIMWPDPNVVGVLGALDTAHLLTLDGIDVSVIQPGVREADEMPLSDIRTAASTARQYCWQLDQRMKARLAFSG